MGNAQDLQFLFRHADAPKHQAVAPEGFNGIDTHATHQLLDLMPPSGHQIHQPLTSNIRIQALYQLWSLGGDAPIALTALTGSAQMFISPNFSALFFNIFSTFVLKS